MDVEFEPYEIDVLNETLLKDFGVTSDYRGRIEVPVKRYLGFSDMERNTTENIGVIINLSDVIGRCVMQNKTTRDDLHNLIAP